MCATVTNANFKSLRGRKRMVKTLQDGDEVWASHSPVSADSGQHQRAVKAGEGWLSKLQVGSICGLFTQNASLDPTGVHGP